MPPRNLEQPCAPTARLPEALAEPAHVAPSGLELLLAHHFPCADAEAALHRSPKHVLGARREVLVDVLLARDRRDTVAAVIGGYLSALLRGLGIPRLSRKGTASFRICRMFPIHLSEAEPSALRPRRCVFTTSGNVVQAE